MKAEACAIHLFAGLLPNIMKRLLCSAINAFEQALYAPNFADPAAGWRKFGNDSTFVDWCAFAVPWVAYVWTAAVVQLDARAAQHWMQGLRNTH